MKRLLTLILSALLVLGMCACGQNGDAAETTEPKLNTAATDADIAQLEALYKDTMAYHGEMHDHSDSYGRSDGKTELKLWAPVVLPGVDADFAAILDHKQSEHMRMDEWDPSLFIGGTEAATTILDDHLDQGSMHYNVIINDPDAMDDFFKSIPEYKFGPDPQNPGRDTFIYAKFVSTRFREVVQELLDRGGFFVHVHPRGRSYLVSNDPLDYWYGDYTGLEVLDGCYDNMKDDRNAEAYDIWVQLLNLGKFVYATSGSDSHRMSQANTLTTLYSTEKHSDAYLELFRAGNFTAGPIGIRMSVGDVCTGDQTDFTGKRLVVSVGDFHSMVPKGEYRLDVYDEEGLVFSEPLAGTETQYFAIDAGDSKYYRANVYSVTEDMIVAVGNPIWNTAAMEAAQ